MIKAAMLFSFRELELIIPHGVRNKKLKELFSFSTKESSMLAVKCIELNPKTDLPVLERFCKF